MFAQKGVELVQELERAKDFLPPFNEDGVRQVLEEMRALFEENQRDASSAVAGESEYITSVHIRHCALERNKRCLMAYLYNRLERIKEHRWHFGSVLPSDIKANICEPEAQFFMKYNKSLAAYMKSIGEGSYSLDLTQNLKPPKNLYIQVKCITEFGEFETEDGDIVVLKKNSLHLLPRVQCELLIAQGDETDGDVQAPTLYHIGLNVRVTKPLTRFFYGAVFREHREKYQRVLALMTIVMTIAYPSLHDLLPKIYQPDKRKDDGAYKSSAERANCCVIPSSSSLGKNP